MKEKSFVKWDDEWLQIDTQLLFQRLTTAADRYIDDTSSIFQFELASIPSSLFDNNGMPREAQKSSLADALWKQCKFEASLPVKILTISAAVTILILNRSMKTTSQLFLMDTLMDQIPKT